MLNKKLLAIAMVSIVAFVAFIAANSIGTETYSEDVVTPSQSGLAGYVKFSGVDGEATETNHNKWSELLAFEQGYHQPEMGSTTGAARRRGSVVVEDITLVKELDKASPKIAEGCLKGKVFPKVEVDLTNHYTDAGNVVYYKFELTNVIVTSYTIGSEDVNNEFPTETITLTFEEVKVTYTESDDDGTSLGNIEYEWKTEKGE
jgi:type VI secretion system secreted protein Hcp